MIDKPDKQKILKLFNTKSFGVVSVTQGAAYASYKGRVSHICSKHTGTPTSYTQVLKITQASCGSEAQLWNFLHYIRISSVKPRQAKPEVTPSERIKDYSSIIKFRRPNMPKYQHVITLVHAVPGWF